MKTTTLAPVKAAAIHVRHILVPVDFSPASEQALHYASGLAELFGAEVTLLHVSEKVSIPGSRQISPKLDVSEREAKAAKNKLHSLVSSLHGNGVAQVHAAHRTGLAGHEIVEAANELDVDLIVIATHGYTGWKHFCIGSTAEQVARSADCPVLVVREKEHDFL